MCLPLFSYHYLINFVPGLQKFVFLFVLGLFFGQFLQSYHLISETWQVVNLLFCKESLAKIIGKHYNRLHFRSLSSYILILI